MRLALLWLAAIVLTWAEVVVATVGGRADRQSTSCRDDRFSRKAAGWEMVFETLLLADMALVMRESLWLGIPIVITAGAAKYWALEKRRKKFRTRTKRKKSRATPPAPQHGSPSEA